MVIITVVTIFLKTLFWTRKIATKLQPLIEASNKIRMKNLDFTIGFCGIREFDEVLESFEKMKNALGDSLKENWRVEENRKTQISALLHDIKTPVTFIKGNAELLNESNLDDYQKDYIQFIKRMFKGLSHIQNLYNR